MIYLFRAVVLFVFLLISQTAKANTITCGQTISSPGVYTLSGNCTCTGNWACITISSNNVTLNLNNNTITCSPSSPGPATNATTFGVQATSLQNVTIFGADPSVANSTGKITGCFFGIQAAYTNQMFIDRVDLSGNTYIGANTGYATNILLTRNVVNGISGYVGDDGRNGYAIAFNGCGTNCTLSGNTIKNIVAQQNAIQPAYGEGVGVILSSNSTGAVMRQNFFDNINESGKNIAIWVASGSSATIEDNTFSGWWQGVSGSGTVVANNNRFMLRQSLHLDSMAIYGSTGYAVGNLIARYVTPISGTIQNVSGNVFYN